MASVKSSITAVFFIALLVAIAVMYQQYNSYLNQRTSLLKSDDENRQLLKKIEEVLPQKGELTKQLADVGQHHEELRHQIPIDMQLDDIKKTVETIFHDKRLKIMAEREIHYNRPNYNEVKLVYSLKGTVNTVRQALAQIKKVPRMVKSTGPDKESKKTTGLAISIFSVKQEDKVKIVTPECMGAPDGIWLPILADELKLLYSDYSQTCQTLMDNTDFYADMQRYRHLNESVLYLENIRDSILKSK